MALFKICRGAETNLPTTLTSGYCYFCTDTTNFYIDYTDTYGALTRAKIASKYADKLRYTEDGNFIELDPTDIVTKSNYETAIGVATSDKNGLMSSSDKTKLDGVESGAQVNVQADWNQSDTTAKDYIKNKICYDFSGWKTVYSEVLEVDASDAIVSTFYPSYTYAYSVTSTSFMAGSTIRIAINDTYIDFVVPESSNNQWGEYTIGNYRVAIVGVSNASSGPYIMGIGCKTDISGSTFSIQKYVNETKTIDEKYLPTYLDKLAYCTCTTAASTQAKVAACSVGQFTLTKGQKAVVKFSNANTTESPTLNIGSTGAKSIYWNGKALPSTQYWEAGAVLEFVYNGSQFELIGIAKDNSKEYSVATTSSDGLFSATDKAKLDGIASGATAVSIDITLTQSGQAADAKAVGDELAKKIDNPQAASIGEVLTVEEVDENSKPTKWKTAPSSSGGSSVFYINITSTTGDSGDTTYSADKTADEIIAAYESGAVMIGVYGEFYMQGVEHIANPNELTLIFAVQELNPINGEITQRQCSVNINKDNKEMQVLYGVATKILDKGIVFMVNNNTVQTSPNSGSFDEILQTIDFSMPLSKSINAILAKDRVVYNLSRLEKNSNGILIKFDDVINSKTYIVFADAKNKTFTYSEEDLPSGGSVGEIDPKKIPDMYYTEVGSVDIAGKIITSITLYRSEEGTLEKVCPFELGQVWKVTTSNYTSDELEVKQSSDGTLYIGDLNKGDPPFYITTTTSSANPNWLSSRGVSGNGVASLVGVSGTMSGGEIIHKIPEQYIPNVVALKNELPDMAIKVIDLDNVIASPTINIDDVDKPVLAIIKCDKNTQFKFDRVVIQTPLHERYTHIAYQSGANSENPYACMMVLIKKIASSDDMFEAICLNAKTKGNTILDIDNSGFENKDYYSLPDGTYNFLSTYTSDSYRIKGFTTVTNHRFKCYDTGDSITFNPNGNIASYGHAYSITETDPTVPKWAKAATKPTYTAEEVGALPNTTVIPTIPTTLPNPNKLTFSGAVTGEYDGSSAVAIEIPKGGKASANFLIQPNGTVLSAPTYAQLTSGTYASFYALYGGTLYALSQQTQTSGTFTFKFNDVPNGKMYVVTVDSSDNTTFVEEELPTTTVTLKTWTSADIS